MLRQDNGNAGRCVWAGVQLSPTAGGSLRAGPGTHRGSSAGRHSTEWYKFFTATSHSRSTAVVLSALWSVATLWTEGDNHGGWGAQIRTGQQTRTWALHPGSAGARHSPLHASVSS